MFKAVRIIKNQSKNLLHNYQMYQFGQIKTFILPDLGEKIKEATVKEWHVKVGDTVEEFQTIADVSTDKLFTQIPSSFDGKITKLYYEEDDIALIGEPFIDIEIEDGVATEDAPAATKQESAPQKEEIQQTKEVEQQTQQFQKIREGKAIAAPATRRLAKELNIDIDAVQGTGPEGRVTDQDVNNFLKQSTKRGNQLTPATRALANQHNIDIDSIEGTGKDGLVTKADILAYVKTMEKDQKKQQEETKQQAATTAAKPSTFDTETIKMTSFAQGMQKSMTASNNIPHLYIKEEIDMTESHQFRELLKKQGNKLTFMSIFVKAFSLALLDFPLINSVYDDSNPFEYKIVNNHNITIAIASPHGLVVPNLKNVQNLNLLEVQEGINALRVKADKGQLGPKELFEGSVSISNIGTVGGTYAAPLIFAPQTSIVAIGRMQDLPRYIDGQLQPRKIVNVSMGCDHRVIDGATAAGFIMKWKQYLENPSSMLLRLK